MLVKEFIEKTGFKVLSGSAGFESSIEGVFVGDLLSWVIGNCKPSQVWVTVQSHMNILAVSALKEIPCIIIAQNANVDEEMIQKAKEEDIAICISDLSAYEIAKKCAELGL